MNKLKTLTISSVLTVLAASCDAASVQNTNFRVQADEIRAHNVQSTPLRPSAKSESADPAALKTR